MGGNSVLVLPKGRLVGRSAGRSVGWGIGLEMPQTNTADVGEDVESEEPETKKTVNRNSTSISMMEYES